MEKFQEWMDGCNAKYPDVTLESHDGMGFGAKLATKRNADDFIIQVPQNILFSSFNAFQDEVIGSKLFNFCKSKVDSGMDKLFLNRFSVYCFLVLQRNLGENSYWVHYLRLLPEWKEFKQNVLNCLDEDIAKRLLMGTHLQTLYEKQKSHTALVFEMANEFCHMFSDGPIHFSEKDLSWAIACFWSRALVVPSRDGLNELAQSCEAMVPLIDLLNHSPGTLSRFNIQDDCITLSYQTSIEENSVLYLNYGARSNGDLLAYFGFTFPNNPADTVHVVTPDNVHHILFYDGIFPPQLLDSVRLLMPTSQENTSPVYKLKSDGMDWREKLLTFQELDIDFSNIGAVIDRHNEAETLKHLENILMDQCDRMHELMKCKDTPLYENITCYCNGQLRILSYFKNLILKMQSELY